MVPLELRCKLRLEATLDLNLVPKNLESLTKIKLSKPKLANQESIRALRLQVDQSPK